MASSTGCRTVLTVGAFRRGLRTEAASTAVERQLVGASAVGCTSVVQVEYAALFPCAIRTLF